MSPRRYCIWSDPIDCLGDHVLRCSYRAFRHSQLPLSTSSSLVNHPSIAISKASFLSFVPLLLMKIPGVHMIPHIAHSGPHPSAILIGLSDTASQAIHMRNFVIAQGYDVGPVIIYQDNMSCMALIKRGGPCSDRSRHINIRHFWLCEKVDVTIEHLGTERMFANVLTKPVQGAQFIRERGQLTNWM